MDKLLQKLETYILYTVVFLLPIAVLGISPNPFEPIKLTILSFGVALALLVRAIRVITTRRLEFSVGTFDFPIALLAVSYVVSTILRTPHKMEALFLPRTATAIVILALVVSIFNMLPGKPFSPRFPSKAVSRGVPIDVLKESPIFGVGP